MRRSSWSAAAVEDDGMEGSGANGGTTSTVGGDLDVEVGPGATEEESTGAVAVGGGWPAMM